jgi:hypothetical protein
MVRGTKVPSANCRDGAIYAQYGLIIFAPCKAAIFGLFSSPSLKESFVSRAFWWNFLQTLGVKVPRGLFCQLFFFFIVLQEAVFSVRLSRSFVSRLSSRFFPCGCTPTHPFVNPSAYQGGRSDSQEPDTECSTATVSLRNGRLNQGYAGG